MAPTMDLTVSLPPFHALLPRAATTDGNPGLTSIFALVVFEAHKLSSSKSRRQPLSEEYNIISKRQQQILVIPTTYANLNDSPSPGTIVGIVLGSILGFLLILALIQQIVRLAFGNRGNDQNTIIEERIRYSSSSSSSSSPSSSSVTPPPAATRRASRTVSQRTSRRTSRRAPPPEPDTVIVEEQLSDPPAEAVVVEEEDDIVEVIEEHSPEPPARRRTRKSGSGGYRIVDPGEFGGGDAPTRRISRRK